MNIGTAVCAAVVAGPDLRLGERIEDVLDVMAEAARGRLCGVRNTTAWLRRAARRPRDEHRAFRGPVALRITSSLEEELALASSLPVGLAGYGLTNSLREAEIITGELQCGGLSINNFGGLGADAPFGGIKESGIGREGGAESLDSYMITKPVLQRTARV